MRDRYYPIICQKCNAVFDYAPAKPDPLAYFICQPCAANFGPDTKLLDYTLRIMANKTKEQKRKAGFNHGK